MIIQDIFDLQTCPICNASKAKPGNDMIHFNCNNKDHDFHYRTYTNSITVFMHYFTIPNSILIKFDKYNFQIIDFFILNRRSLIDQKSSKINLNPIMFDKAANFQQLFKQIFRLLTFS